VAAGQDIDVWVDGVHVLHALDSTWSSGTVGLYCRENQGACFDDITVRDLVDGTYLLDDDFDIGMAGWVVIDQSDLPGPSRWSATTGVLVQSSNIYLSTRTWLSKEGTLAIYDPQPWTDYVFDLTLSSDDNDDVGVVFRYQDTSNYYRFSWSSQQSNRRLIKCLDGQFTLLAWDSVPYVVEQEYAVSVIAAGPDMDVWVDGDRVFHAVDSGVASGRIGLYCWQNAGAYFDDVVVTDMTDASVLLSDDFSAGNLDQWIVADEGDIRAPSVWSVTSGEASQISDIYKIGSSYLDKPGTVLVSVSGPVPPGMVLIPAGEFQMGDSFDESGVFSGELPVHMVTVDSFYMGKYEITNQQYCDYLSSALAQGLITVTEGVVYQAGSGTDYSYCDTSTSSSNSRIAYSGSVFSVRTKGGRSMMNDPMVLVSWYGSVAYCNWRSQQEGYVSCYDLSTWTCDFMKRGYRLATEAEWEYAARGGLAGKRFPWGDTITHSQANYFSVSDHSYDVSSTRGFHPAWDDGVFPYTSPVGSFEANGYGLYNMAGNVWEWCNNWYGSYSSDSQANPTGPASGLTRIFRGGGWSSYGAFFCRVTYRHHDWPDIHRNSCGFRVVLDF